MSSSAIQREFLARAGQLLLEYNDSVREIKQSLEATARSFSDETFEVAVTYQGVIVSGGDQAPIVKPVSELRYNQALQASIHSILRRVRSSEITAEEALPLLDNAKKHTSSYSSWLVAAILGFAAASLARILGADSGAMVISGVSSALGLLARKGLARCRFSLLVLPFTAAFIGGALAGIAIGFGWTETPGLALIVPSLMLVPGPHLLNGLFDLVDNHVAMSVARLTLATGILLASAAGIVLGIEMTISEIPPASQTSAAHNLDLSLDMFLAGLVTCGFAVFYNASWQQTLLAAVGGMLGHGTRFLALENGVRIDFATFFGALIVGVIAAGIARFYKTPVAVIAFAGAVTMMPGVQMFRALGSALQIARLKSEIDPDRVSACLGDALQSAFIVSALALGLVIATRSVSAFFGTYSNMLGLEKD